MNYLIDDSCKTSKKEPGLIVFLHGAGERGEDFEKLYVHGPAKYIRNGSFKPETVVLCPQCPDGYIWNLLTEELYELIEATVENYGIDRSRIAITGISMGGYGTWEMGMSYPDYFSALGPVCGGGVSWRAKLIGKTPVWAFHGDADNVVWIILDHVRVQIHKCLTHTLCPPPAPLTRHSLLPLPWATRSAQDKASRWCCRRRSGGAR